MLTTCTVKRGPTQPFRDDGLHNKRIKFPLCILRAICTYVLGPVKVYMIARSVIQQVYYIGVYLFVYTDLICIHDILQYTLESSIMSSYLRICVLT